MHVVGELDRMDDEIVAAEQAGASVGAVEALRAERAEMRRTLDRVDDLTYGVCEICHDFIGIDRLMALPATSRCKRCAR